MPATAPRPGRSSASGCCFPRSSLSSSSTGDLMTLTYRVILTGLASAGAAAPAGASTVELTVKVPQLRVAEYHRPYVAIWLEQPGKPGIRTLAVWYDHDNRENGGTKWLRDLRSWWRK